MLGIPFGPGTAMNQPPPSTTRCKECGHVVSSRDKKCPLCGSPIESTTSPKYAPHLGWLLVVPAVAILAFAILWRPNTGTTNRTSVPAPQQSRPESASRTPASTPTPQQPRAEGPRGSQEPTSRRGSIQSPDETPRPISPPGRSELAVADPQAPTPTRT